MDFDFDKMAQLAKQDPAAFETLRREMIERMIAGFHPDTRRRSGGFQFQIDMERLKSKDSESAYIKLSHMLKDKCATNVSSVMETLSSTGLATEMPSQERKEGELLPFARPAGK